MAKDSIDQADQKSLALSKYSIFGPAPILEEEDAECYNELLAGVSREVKATGIIEEIWIRDLVDLTWEILRWRRLRTALLSERVSRALSDRLAWLMRRKSKKTSDMLAAFPAFRLIPTSTRKLVKKWTARDPTAVDRVNKLMAAANVTMDMVMADAFIEKLDSIERIDRLIAIAEARRNSILREVDLHRATLAKNLRATVENVEEAEFVIVESTAAGTDKEIT